MRLKKKSIPALEKSWRTVFSGGDVFALFGHFYKQKDVLRSVKKDPIMGKKQEKGLKEAV